MFSFKNSKILILETIGYNILKAIEILTNDSFTIKIWITKSILKFRI